MPLRSPPSRRALHGATGIDRLRRVEADQPDALGLPPDPDVDRVAVDDANDRSRLAADYLTGGGRRGCGGGHGPSGARLAVRVVGTLIAAPEIAADVAARVRRARVPAVTAGAVGVGLRRDSSKERNYQNDGGTSRDCLCNSHRQHLGAQPGVCHRGHRITELLRTERGLPAPSALSVVPYQSVELAPGDTPAQLFALREPIDAASPNL